MRSLLIACLAFVPASAIADPIFPNSVVSNDIDFIKTSDASAFYCLTYLGQGRKEMPDKRSDALFANGVHTFEAWYTDGSVVGIWVHPQVGSRAAAEQMAGKVVNPVGRLPSFMRKKLRHVVIHDGDETAFGEDEGRFFVLYSQNIAKRISTHDLEETVFHEAVHATMDVPVARSEGWRRAQRRDNAFATEYAASLPEREDLAETALFAYAYYQHPERLPRSVRAALEQAVPNRLAFLKDYFGPGQAMQQPVSGLRACGS